MSQPWPSYRRLENLLVDVAGELSAWTYTLVNAVIAWHHIQKHSGGIIEEDWTHKNIKYIIKPKQLTPVAPPLLVKKPQLKGQSNFQWKDIWTPEFPPKIRELLWRAAYNALPSRNRLRHFTQLDQNCTLCGEYEDGPHMARWCPELKHFFGSLSFLCCDLPDRVGNLIYGIAHYAAYWIMCKPDSMGQPDLNEHSPPNSNSY